MIFHPLRMTGGLWLLWLLFWLVTARHVKPIRWNERLGLQLRYRVPMFCAIFLLCAREPWPPSLLQRFLPANSVTAVAAVLLVGAGLGFSVWARHYLGANWSATVALKENHTLVRSGPYRYVRHPIYTGMLLAFLGTAFVVGEWRGPLAFGIAFLSFLYKSRLEEKLMRATFPDYEAYQRETAALIPFVL